MAIKNSIDALRGAVNLFDHCNESFNLKYTADELLKIYFMHCFADDDYFPDQWTEKQVKQALKGHIPKWDQDDNPIYNPSLD